MTHRIKKWAAVIAAAHYEGVSPPNIHRDPAGSSNNQMNVERGDRYQKGGVVKADDGPQTGSCGLRRAVLATRRAALK